MIMAKDQEHSVTPLLPTYHDEEMESNSTFRKSRKNTYEGLWLRSRKEKMMYSPSLHVLPHLLFFASYTLIFLYFASTNTSYTATGDVVNLLQLPARKALHWETRLFPTFITDNAFAGEPRPELEAAWHTLLRNDIIHVEKDDLYALNITSLYLKDSSEAIASLGVYHTLHCLKKVRHMTYKDWYHKRKDEVQMSRERFHVDHCIEYIREYLMCKPDLSLVTFSWINETAQHADPSAQYPTQSDGSLHECVNWEGIEAWAGERTFDLFQTDLLCRPEHGLHYEEP